MRTVLFLLTVLILTLSGRAYGLCILENATFAHCTDLEDARYINTYDLEKLKASVHTKMLDHRSFENFTSLRKLDLSEGNIENIEFGTFRKLSHLENLNLAGNRIAQLKLTVFEGLQNLQTLDLRRNSIKQLSPALIKLKNLKILDLSGNPLDCNCATIKVRDLLVANGVRMSKKILCASPPILKGASLMKPNAGVSCMFEEQDKEMQADEPVDIEGSGDLGSGDAFEELDQNLDEDEDLFDEEVEPPSPPTTEAETPVPNVPSTAASQASSAAAPVLLSLGLVPQDNTTESPVSNSPASSETTFERDDSLFFETEDVTEEEPPSTTEPTEKKDELSDDLLIPVYVEQVSSVLSSTPKSSEKTHKFTDELIIPVEGSGTEDIGSGAEGSGSDFPLTDWTHSGSEVSREFGRPESSTVESVVVESSTTENPDTSTSDNSGNPFDIILGLFWSPTDAPEEKKEVALEEEEFIDVSSESSLGPSGTPAEEEILPPMAAVPVEPSISAENNEPSDIEPIVPLISRMGIIPESSDKESSSGSNTAGNVGSDKVDASAGTNEEMADVSPTRQAKKGTGSYVVLAALLAILAALIGFAAYKGDFCRKKRKRRDVENGRELQDMQKSLLDGSNANRPKISSNGNAENAPLVGSQGQHWSEQRDLRPWQDHQEPAVVDPKSKYEEAVQDAVDPVKPPRKSLTSPEEARTETKDIPSDSPIEYRAGGVAIIRNPPQPVLAPLHRSPSPIHASNGPPLSPGAERVKILMQENPDSIPKTPILITRTKAGENLVKAP
ncbi:protein windpipe isoform X2 [Cephus cinctus]|nr:protein windpipe isoform X2 [Cephus cinctus]